MSLGVSLFGDSYEEECICSCGHNHTAEKHAEFFTAHITHNLCPMAKEAGIYVEL